MTYSTTLMNFYSETKMDLSPLEGFQDTEDYGCALLADEITDYPALN